MKKVLVIQGHPDAGGNHLCHALAERYAQAAAAAGCEVRRLDIARLDFPVLRDGKDFYEARAPETIVCAQQEIAWADHLAFVYPLWIGDVPALFKAFIEQTFRPGFAMGYGGKGRFPKPLLAGKTARLIVTMGMPAAAYRSFFGKHTVKSLELNLNMCGIQTIGETLVGGVAEARAARAARWLGAMEGIARHDARPKRVRSRRGAAFGALATVVGAGAAAYAAYAALAWARFGSRGHTHCMLDDVMPTYDVRLEHETRVRASVDTTFDSICHANFESSPIVQALFRAREIFMRAKRIEPIVSSGLLDQLRTLGWSVVAEEPGRELVFAAVTQPWQANPVFRGLEREEFVRFAEPGYAKIAFTLRVDPDRDGCTLARTETRVRVTDPQSRERFRAYWALVSPGIEIVRIALLHQLKSNAESPVHAT